MATIYLDSSAFVKLYVAETHSEAVRAAVTQAENVACHLIGHTEVRAALAAAQRLGRITSADHATQRDQFLRDWRQCATVGSDEALVTRAGELAEGFALRGFDAVHLAAAERLFRALGPALVMWTFDEAQGRAARLLGMTLGQPEPAQRTV